MHRNKNDQKESKDMKLKICKKTRFTFSIPVLVLKSVRRGNRRKHHVRRLSRMGE